MTQDQLKKMIETAKTLKEKLLI